MLSDHGKKEWKRHDLKMETFQKERDEWKKERLKSWISSIRDYVINSMQSRQLPTSKMV